MKIKQSIIGEITDNIGGEIRLDDLHQTLYATDASIYKEKPIGVVYPKDQKDVQHIVRIANQYGIPLIPRAAGTSLAGQCVGGGLVVDISLHMNKIIAFNQEEKWIKVQPGVIRDELNNYLKPFGLFFGPNTSTANRCMIGGMVGNNSCGSTSIEFGNTRDHVIGLDIVLSDGSLMEVKPVDHVEDYISKIENPLERKVYDYFIELLSQSDVRDLVLSAYPHQEIKRRNQGYALDALLNMVPFDQNNGESFNLSKILCGSEGTLAFTTGITLNLVDLPSEHVAVVCGHYSTISDSMKATLVAMKHQPSKCELMDKTVLDCARTNPDQLKNMFFVVDDPQAILTVEFRGQTIEEAQQKADLLVNDLQSQQLGFANPIVLGKQTDQIWELRSAGLGVLSNVKGDAKPLACIEDTAVRIEDLPEYIAEFEEICLQHHQKAVFYAHAGAGELHLRPILNLKDPKDVKGLRDISEASARLVKKYNGVLSGEHGDGRLRGEFLPFMVGEQVYDIWKDIKQLWDPNNIFNPGKIVNSPPMDEELRYSVNEADWSTDTVFDYSESGGMMRAIEKCNGTGDCRRIAESGGTMCPSYMATRQEKDTTRGRANVMREYMKGNGEETSFTSPEVMEVLDLCLSCKGCRAECPSNVDMARLKAEYSHKYYQTNRRKYRDYLVLNFYSMYGWASIWPAFSNFMIKNFGKVIKSVAGFAPERSLPLVAKTSWKKWLQQNPSTIKPHQTKTVYLFVDEFVDRNEAELGIVTTKLLRQLGYDVRFQSHAESGRAAFSKGFLDVAVELATENIKTFGPLLNDNAVLVGIEPSAVLSFRDEYPDVVRGELKSMADKIKPLVFTIEEFLWKEYENGNISSTDFDDMQRMVKLHLHCHYKSLGDKTAPQSILSIPTGHHIEYIKSGCCGMAGSFGFEKEHYELSTSVGELVLFPQVRNASEQYLIAAQGVSCRHQIKDGTDRTALHPVEILYSALKK